MSGASVGAAAAVRTTVREELLDALRSASEHNCSDVVPPAVVLWTDKERRWETVIPSLRGELPLLTLGPYDPEVLTGPVIWLRCVLAGTLPEVVLSEGTPVVYLPGVSRSDLRAVEDCPEYLQPLSELQYRGINLVELLFFGLEVALVFIARLFYFQGYSLDDLESKPLQLDLPWFSEHLLLRRLVCVSLTSSCS